MNMYVNVYTNVHVYYTRTNMYLNTHHSKLFYKRHVPASYDILQYLYIVKIIAIIKDKMAI